MAIAVQVETATRNSALNTEKNADGQVKRLHHIPRPASKEAERRWLLGQMAALFRIFAKLGFADGSSGHISLRGIGDKNEIEVLFSLLTIYLLDQPLRCTLCLA